MMRTFSTKSLVGPAVFALLAVTMLSGCWVTSGALDERLTKFKTVDMAETVSQAADGATKIPKLEKSVTDIGKEVEALKTLGTKLEDLGGKVDAITKKLDALEDVPESVAANKKSLAALRTEADAAKLARAELMTELAKKALKSKLDDLSKSMDTNVARLDNKDKELAEKDTSLTASVKELNEFKEAAALDIKSAKTLVLKLEDDMKGLTERTNAAMTAHNEKITTFSGGVLTSVGKEIEMLEKRIATLKEVLALFEKFKKVKGGTNGKVRPKQ